MPYICCVTAYRTENFENRIKKSSMDSMMVKPVFKGEIHDILIKSGINLSWEQIFSSSLYTGYHNAFTR